MSGNANLSNDEIRYKIEAETLSRRRLIRDVCAFTGWVFLAQTQVTRAADPTVDGDPDNKLKEWGAIKGRLVFDGPIPERKEVDLDKSNLSASDLMWFKSMGPILNQEWVVDRQSRAIQWVYVWLLPEDPKGKMIVHPSRLPVPADRKLVVVDQEPSGYVPHAVALQPGQGLLMRNRGPVTHVFNMTAFANPSFNRAMNSGSEIDLPDLKFEKSAIQINCPPHPWERMWLRTFAHPYFAATGADGSFEIKLAPAGKCRLVVWHEQSGFLGGRAGRDGAIVEVTGAAVTDLGDLKLASKA